MSSSIYKSACATLILLTAPVQPGPWLDFSGTSHIRTLGNHVRIGGPGKDGIPAMTRPDFVAAAEGNRHTLDGDLVMGVYMHGVAKAYPEELGWHHEVINDEIGGQAISVTLCPLTGTALNFNATDEDGQPFELGVSGLLMNSNLVMYDRRDDLTLYAQMIYTAFNGPLTGEELELLPVLETTWGMWKRMHPDTQIAVRGTGLASYSESRQIAYRDVDRYGFYPYQDYRTSRQLLFPLTTESPDLESRHPKDIVLGICRDGAVKSYAFAAMPDGAVINDEYGEERVVVTFDKDSGTAIPYFSNIDGRQLTFYAVEATGDLPVEFQDVETGTRWNMLGRAIEGELEGHRLERVPAYNSMWFAWDTYWRGAPVWKGEGIIDAPPVATAVEDEGGGAGGASMMPAQFALGQNFPNPFNPATHVQVSLPRQSTVSVRVYDTVGQLVRTLMQGEQEAGLYLLAWDGRNEAGIEVASGTYLYRLQAPQAGLDQTRTMTLLR